MTYTADGDNLGGGNGKSTQTLGVMLQLVLLFACITYFHRQAILQQALKSAVL